MVPSKVRQMEVDTGIGRSAGSEVRRAIVQEDLLDIIILFLCVFGWIESEQDGAA